MLRRVSSAREELTCAHPSSEAPPRRPSRTPRRVHPPRRRARAVLFIHVFIRVVLVHARRQAAVAPRDPTRLAPSRRARRLNLFSRGRPPRRSLAGRLRHARGARGVGPARDARLPRRARARPLAPRAPDRADAPRAPERRRVVVVVRSSSPSTSSLSRVDDDSPRARVGGDDERTQKQLAEDARLEPVRPAPGARPGVERPTDGSGRASRALQARSVRSPYYAGTPRDRVRAVHAVPRGRTFPGVRCVRFSPPTIPRWFQSRRAAMPFDSFN